MIRRTLARAVRRCLATTKRAYVASPLKDPNPEPSLPKTFIKDSESKSFADPTQTKTKDSKQPPAPSANTDLVLSDMQSWIAKQEKRRELMRKEEAEVGLEKFDRCLTNTERYNRLAEEKKALTLANSAKWQTLGNLILERNAKLPVKEEYKYSLTAKQELIYKEVMYDHYSCGKISARAKERLTTFYSSNPVPRQNTLNYLKQGAQSRQFADLIKPEYPKFSHTMVTPIGNYTDVYNWLKNPEHTNFQQIKQAEEDYANLMSARFDLLRGSIMADLNAQRPQSHRKPVPMYQFAYDRKQTDSADFLSIYRTREGNPELPTEERTREEAVFSVDDLHRLYKDHGEQHPEIKNFVEQLKDYVDKSSDDPIQTFLVDRTDKYLAISFCLEEKDAR